MTRIILHRGITVNEYEADMIIEDIKTNGLCLSEKQKWGKFVWKDLRNEHDFLLNKENLTREDTLPASVWINKKNGGYREFVDGETGVCFADRVGAEYYAKVHNKSEVNSTPLIISVELNSEKLAIDGRDFLYTVFSFINGKDLIKTKRQIKIMRELYGNKIEFYMEKIINQPNSDKFAICDLAIIDEEIIIEHSKNQKVIRGRYNTIFKSAFFGSVPIQPEKIKNVERLSNNYKKLIPDITLDDVL